MTGVGVIVPWRASPDRQAVWDWLRHHLWRDLYQDWQLVEGYCPESSPWCKAHAVSDGITRLDRGIETLVVADADVWCDQVHAAVVAVENGAPWAMPHDKVYRLKPGPTADLLASNLWLGVPRGPTIRKPYRGWPGGGLVVLRRSTYELAPLDHRFVGWGQEDESWALALTLLAGPCVRGDAPLVHLHHEPQPRMTSEHGSKESRWLADRYREAAGRGREAMAALVDAGRPVGVGR